MTGFGLNNVVHSSLDIPMDPLLKIKCKYAAKS